MIYFLWKIIIVLFNAKRINISTKYSYFTNIFSSDSVIELSRYIDINNYLIHLLDNEQLLYDLIHSLELVKLKILKTYIKINLASGFI